MPTVLLIDDSDDDLILLSRDLSRAGFRLIHAADKETALQALRQRPDIFAVVTDTRYPDRKGAPINPGAGLECAQEILKMSPHPMVIGTSSEPEYAIQYEAMGVRFVQKAQGYGRKVAEILQAPEPVPPSGTQRGSPQGPGGTK